MRRVWFKLRLYKPEAGVVRWTGPLSFVLAIALVGCGGGAGEPAKKSGSEKPSGAEAAPPRPPARVELVWPTPNTAYTEGRGLEEFVQATASGVVTSGLFGSVRSGGRQFHEGLDLFPKTRDRAGEALDPVNAALAGVVRHVSNKAGASSYGRYIVLEHPSFSPPVYTLYAHLAEISPGIAPGVGVNAGDRIATLGRSAGGYTIPKDRAHLHFEIGVRMMDSFAAWYRKRGFGSPNPHGLYNGMNLMGLDPLEFYSRHRDGALTSLDQVFQALPAAVTAKIAHAGEPNFLRRYPSLWQREAGREIGSGGGWEVDFSATGVPLRWRRLAAEEVLGWKRNEVRIVSADRPLLAANRGRSLLETKRGLDTPGDDLRTVLDQLFEF
jgi:murein DD-endopeptidase MepM/ murein hydrolase activator NlpD